MTTDLLRLSGLSVGYGDVPVLKDVDLRVEAGEWVAVIGSNGVGKSTLLRTIAGLLRPRSGSVLWEGLDITPMRAPARVTRGISLVPEGKRLFAGMTVRENLLLGAFARSDGDAVKRDLDRVFALFPALRDKAARIAGTLSGGEQQMCSLGRGLMARPRLLLVDELSFGLSPALTSELLEAVAGIVREGLSVLLVEQDVFAALKRAHRGYVIGSGRVLKTGAGRDLIADPMIRKAYLGM